MITLLSACDSSGPFGTDNPLARPAPATDGLAPQFQQSMRSEAVAVNTLLTQADALLAAGKVQDAARLMKRADKHLGTVESAIQANMLHGRIAMAEGRHRAARRHFNDAVRRDPRFLPGWLGIGQAADQQENYGEAAEAYARARALQPDHPNVLNDLAMSALRQNRPTEAIPLLQQALRAKPDHVVAAGNLRIARAMTGDYDGALLGVGSSERPDVLNNIGYIALGRGDIDVAERMLTEAMRVSPVYHTKAAANLTELRRLTGAGAARGP